MKTTRYLLALRPDVPVERHGGDPEFTAERGHGGVAVRHRGLGQPHLSFRQRERPGIVASARPRGREPGQGAFTDQLPLELGQRREDAEHEAAGRRGGVDLRALPSEHPQAHAAGREVLHGVDQVGEVAAEAVELPDDEHVARPERAHAAVEPRSVSTAGMVAGLLALSFVVQVTRVLQAYVFGRGLGIDVAFSYYLAFMPVCILIILLPILIGGLGVAQGVTITLLRPVGVPDDEQSFALSTILVLAALLSATPGALLLIRHRMAGARP